VFRETAERYASYGIEVEDMIVDNASMQVQYAVYYLSTNFEASW